jgi:hypothetical protein
MKKLRSSLFNSNHRVKKSVAVAGLGILITLVMGASGIATIAAAENLSRSFTAKNDIVPGNLVSLSSDNDEEVVLATKQNDDYLLGIAVESENSLLAVNSETNKIQVAISGQAMAIVSDINGNISTGDFIAQSSINGLGAKAQNGDMVIGVAQAAFSSDSENARQEDVTDDQGQTKSVYVGIIPVQLAVTSTSGDEDGNPSALERLASKIAGKPVSVLRLSICAAIAVIGLVSIIVIIYSSVKNSIMAAGRNPLAKPMIYGSLAQIMSMTALIAVIAVVAMYLAVAL